MSQGTLLVPIVGPVTPTAFAGDINTSVSALVSKNSGGSAPANFSGGASALQDWGDTSPGGGIVDEREFDGTSWLNKGAQDQTGHVWMPKVGGGSGTIASGGTVDLGSVRQSYVLITGASPSTPITSFGSNALLNIGETKFVRFSAGTAGIIAYNATSMILPGAADLPFNAGDSLQALYLGGGNWLCYDFRSNVSPVDRNTGDVFEAWGLAALSGAVRANGNTIGNGASGGTERANTDTVNLFIFLYTRDTSLAVSGGRTAPGNTRAAAITDFNLNKTITLPDLRLAKPLGPPTILTSGTGATFNVPAAATGIKCLMSGGGGGGGAATANNGTNGTDTSFESWVAKAGIGGSFGAGVGPGAGGTGGANGTGILLRRRDGGKGGFAWANGSNNAFGGMGGQNELAGAVSALGAPQGISAIAAVPNTGAGGQGAGQGTAGGHGGGSGELVEFYMTSPPTPITYTVGAKGTGGAAGGNAGGDGANGVIIVQAYGPQQYLAL